MNQKIKQREEELKNREEQIKKALNQEGNLLKRKANKVGKIALAAGMVSLILYWIYNAFFVSEEEQTIKRPKKTQTSTFSQRILKLLTPYATKLLSDLIAQEGPKEEKND